MNNIVLCYLNSKKGFSASMLHVRNIKKQAIRNFGQFLILLLIAYSNISVAATAAKDEQDATVSKERLQTLKNDIDRLKKWLEEAQRQKSEVKKELQDTEDSILELNQQVDEIKSKINEREQSREQLNNKQENLRAQLRRDKISLLKGLKLAYLKPQTNPLKIILNQEQPHKSVRLLKYYNYFSKAQTKRIQVATDSLMMLKDTERLLTEESERLKTLKSTLANRISIIQLEREKRNILLANLDRKVKRNSSNLSNLRQEYENLEQLLAQLRSQLSLKQKEAFGQRRGNLPWPIRGAVKQKFGDTKLAGKMRWNGLVIKARSSELVKAVHYGQVIFADAFKGFGQLIIIDHGSGFMSLYAYNNRLDHKVGDWVVPGEPIAAIGSIDGFTGTNLYFELRRDGRPFDPEPWLQ